MEKSWLLNDGVVDVVMQLSITLTGANVCLDLMIDDVRPQVFVLCLVRLIFFFFQAEDGIRDKLVTGVQTCALPISRCSRAPTGTSDTPWWRAVGSPKRWNSGTSGSGSLPGWTRSSGRSRRCSAPRGRRRCWPAPHGSMADEVKTLSTQLAQDPQSLVFLRLGELLRQKRQLDAARRVALIGLERHPHLADAHDLYARILADRHDYEHAFDEWDMTLRIAPEHTGALKGIAFLYFKVGDLAQAEAHLRAAKRIVPDDPSVDQAIAMVRGGVASPPPSAAAQAPAAAAPPPEEARIFAGLEGAEEGLLLLDGAGPGLGGRLP